MTQVGQLLLDGAIKEFMGAATAYKGRRSRGMAQGCARLRGQDDATDARHEPAAQFVTPDIHVELGSSPDTRFHVSECIASQPSLQKLGSDWRAEKDTWYTLAATHRTPIPVKSFQRSPQMHGPCVHLENSKDGLLCP
jgi:hypothetical protein